MTKRFVALMLAFIMAVPCLGSICVSGVDADITPIDTDLLSDLIPTADQPEPYYPMLDFALSDDESYYILLSCNQSATSAEIPESYKGLPVKEIGDGAFYGCELLKDLVIPPSVTTIGTEAFKYCIALEELEIPEGVRVIGDEAFSNCESLKSIVIPASAREIGGWLIAFCNALESLTVAEGNTNFYSADNCIIHKPSKTLVAGCNKSVIPADGSVTSIGYAAFAGFDGIAEFTVPQSIVEIEASAFSHCNGLESIEIPLTVEKMGAIVFAKCENLAEIHCEAAEKPDSWNNRWVEYCDATVYWAGVPEAKPEIPDDSSDDSSVESSEDSSEDSSSEPSDDPSNDEPSVPTDDQPDDGDEEPENNANGDINGNGIIDSMDYVYLKRAYFGTYKLKDLAVGDINKNHVIDSMDYVYLKRAYFGTYKIK